MKKLFCLLVALSALTVWGQDPEVNLKWGKPSEAEMTMTECALDPDAEAVVLYNNEECALDMHAGQFRLTTTVKRRIKVLKPEGRELANVAFAFYKTTMKEGAYANKIAATAYNIVDGQTVATKMKDDLVFKEDINDYTRQYKFTIPQVSVGTVFEYQFTISTTRYWDVPIWYAQTDLPVLYTHYEFRRPQYFNFHLEQTGIAPIEAKESQKSMTLNTGKVMLTTVELCSEFTGKNVPALKRTPYVFCVSEYRTRVKAELNYVNIPEIQYHKEYTTTWEHVVTDYCENENFGGHIFRKSPVKDEIESLGIAKIEDTDERVTAVWNLLQKKITWNGVVDLIPSRSRSTVNDGYGTSSDVNCLLIQMLRDAGIPAWPVLVCRRSLGHIPLTFPSGESFNTFVVAYSVDEEESYNFLDASCKYGYIDALNPDLMTDRGLLVHENKTGKWVNLQAITGNNITHQITAKIDAEGMLTGHMTQVHRKGRTFDFRSEYAEVKDSAQYINELAVKNDIELSNYSHEGVKEFSPSVVINYDFEHQCLVSGGKIYCNQLVLPQVHEELPQEEDRKLPFEFPVQQSERIQTTLELPQGYTVEQMPQPINMSTPDGALRVTCQSSLEDGKLVSIFQYNIRKTFFAAEEYEALRTLMNKAVEKNLEIVSLIPAN